MLKKIMMPFSLLLAMTAINGCSSQWNMMGSGHYTQCQQMRMQMTYNSINNNTEASYLTPTQQKRLRDRYEQTCR